MITYTCHVCGFPIGGDTGILYCPWTEINAAHSHDVDEIRHPRGAITLGELMALDIPSATWRTRHVTCEEGVDENVRFGYEIDTDKVCTAEGILEWTVHLFSKNWFASTNWDSFLRGALS